LSLTSNAADAMPHGGRLVFETANVDEPGPRADPIVPPRAAPDGPAGPQVRLTVTDTGHGMDEATRAHAFEPFFTTKGVGKGTGLGLAATFGFVTQSGGDIELDSEPGLGTTIQIFLPRVDLVAEEPAPAPGLTGVSPAARTVLVAEDDEMVRTVICELLRTQGYHLLEARNGQRALRIAAAHAGPIELLVTDVVMPGMSGPELVAAIRRERPGLQVLYMSGYADAVCDQARLEPDAAFLKKPFSCEALISRVREMAGRSGRDPDPA
jgi:CheY-like chemotaxis protein